MAKAATVSAGNSPLGLQLYACGSQDSCLQCVNAGILHANLVKTAQLTRTQWNPIKTNGWH